MDTIVPLLIVVVVVCIMASNDRKPEYEPKDSKEPSDGDFE